MLYPSGEPEQPRMARTRCRTAAMVPVLLVAFFLRLHGLGALDGMLSYDEAYYGVDALSLLEHPRLTPFFEGNNGREAGWMYVLAPFVAVLGARPLALRLAAAMVGTVTVAATYRLGRELLHGPAALWAAGALATLYWPVHMSHLGLRANLYPMVGTLALGALLRARREGHLRLWVLGGVSSGLLLYTYYSGLPWALLLWGLMLHDVWRHRGRRRGPACALAVAALVSLPMVWYVLRHGSAALGRPQDVAVVDAAGLWANVRLWAAAWFVQGDLTAMFGVPGRPILGAASGVLGIVGLVALWWAARGRHSIGWVLALAVASLAPSLLSDHAPHTLRALGLTVPLTLVMGAGGRGIVQGLRRVRASAWAGAAPVPLLLLMGSASYVNLDRWLADPEVYIGMEVHINSAVNQVRGGTPTDQPVLFSPLSLSHPVLRFRRADLQPRPVRAFDSHQCLLLMDRPATYVSLTMYEPAFAEQLGRWLDLDLLYEDESATEEAPRYHVYSAQPRESNPLTGAYAPAFGEALELRLLDDLPGSVRPGDTLGVPLGLRALQPLDDVYSVFVHLYSRQQAPGTPPVAQGDQQLCASYPTTLWQTDETIVQTFAVSLPDDLPPGEYALVIGVYHAPDGPRLPVSGGEQGGVDCVEIATIWIPET